LGLFHENIETPLVFIETSLVDRLANQVEPLLNCSVEWHDSQQPTHAIFYAIVSTQPLALSGLELGKTLIYAVASALSGQKQSSSSPTTQRSTQDYIDTLDLSKLGKFPNYGIFWLFLITHISSSILAILSTLSPMPLFKSWTKLVDKPDEARLKHLSHSYLLRAKRLSSHFAFDPVQHFHLGNGARIESINLNADLSGKLSHTLTLFFYIYSQQYCIMTILENGMSSSFGVMVNYRYILSDIQSNSFNYFQNGQIDVCQEKISNINRTPNAKL
jgi:malonyl-CoA decarboxylase